MFRVLNSYSRFCQNQFTVLLLKIGDVFEHSMSEAMYKAISLRGRVQHGCWNKNEIRSGQVGEW